MGAQSTSSWVRLVSRSTRTLIPTCKNGLSPSPRNKALRLMNGHGATSRVSGSKIGTATRTTPNTAATCTSSTSNRGWLKTASTSGGNRADLHGVCAPSICQHHGQSPILATHSQAMYRDYWDGRKYNVSASKFADKSYVFWLTTIMAEWLHWSSASTLKASKCSPTMLLSKSRVRQRSSAVKSADSPFPRDLIIPNRQPDAPLVAAILELMRRSENPFSLRSGSAPP